MKKIQHQLTENVKLLQKVVLRHGDKVLILKRAENSDSRPLAWDLPGGNSEWPETLESKGGFHQKDAAREVFEESGIEIPLDKFSIENLICFRTFFEAQKQVFSIITGWRVDLEDNFDEKSIKISEEHIKYEWITLDKIDDYNFGGFKGEFIKDMIRNVFKND